MRIVLQHKVTALYVQNVNTWTPYSAEAMDFLSSSAAINFCFDHRIDCMQIVLKFDEEKYDIVMQGGFLPDNSARRLTA